MIDICKNSTYDERYRLNGESIEGLPGHKIARKGVVRTFQNVRLFKDCLLYTSTGLASLCAYCLRT